MIVTVVIISIIIVIILIIIILSSCFPCMRLGISRDVRKYAEHMGTCSEKRDLHSKNFMFLKIC